MNETVLQVYKKGKCIAVLGMNTMPNFRFMQKVHLESWSYDRAKITHLEELFGKVLCVKHKLITTINYEDGKWIGSSFKSIVQLYLF